MKDFWEEQRKMDLERKAREYGINKDVFNLEGRVKEEQYKRQHSRKSIFSDTPSSGSTGKIGFVVLMLVFGIYFGQKIMNHYENKKLYDPSRFYKINSDDNSLLNTLKGKDVKDWAEALEEYGTVYKNISAQGFRDIADSTQVELSYYSQTVLMKSFGKDFWGNDLMTRDIVREVKSAYKK